MWVGIAGAALALLAVPGRASEGGDRAAEVLLAGYSAGEASESSVFVKLTTPVDVVAQHQDRQLRYRLEGARLSGDNNRHALPTRHFGGPIDRVSLAAVGGGVELRIDLKEVLTAAPDWQQKTAGSISTVSVQLPRSAER